MCSVSISEQEVSQIDAVTESIVSVTVTDSAKASGTIVINAADHRDNAHNLET